MFAALKCGYRTSKQQTRSCYSGDSPAKAPSVIWHCCRCLPVHKTMSMGLSCHFPQSAAMLSAGATNVPEACSLTGHCKDRLPEAAAKLCLDTCRSSATCTCWFLKPCWLRVNGKGEGDRLSRGSAPIRTQSQGFDGGSSSDLYLKSDIGDLQQARRNV